MCVWSFTNEEQNPTVVCRATTNEKLSLKEIVSQNLIELFINKYRDTGFEINNRWFVCLFVYVSEKITQN